LVESPPIETETQGKKNISQMVKVVSEQLGNTVTVCRKYYIHPRVLDRYMDGTLDTFVYADETPNGLRPEEAALMTLLQARQ
jgi:DNA topoisomerase-1